VPGDYTRLTFDPLKDRAMLLEQQGRVHLDANFNEAVEIASRRLRVETRDVVGPAVYPAILPDSFKLKHPAGGQWTIGRGRMYVDGLLAENHGAGQREYEPVWDEPQGVDDTPVGKQPYVGTLEDPQIGGGENELAYLDVWLRELTSVEDPSMLEPALGVDTATRVQTAWQVRRLELADDGMDCGSDWDGFGPWQDIVRRSDARLSSAAAQPPDPADPCAVAPTGGYRGLENRLYRVEIHKPGPVGEATMKWSRDNGAIASRITALTGGAQPVVTVERLGRDEVLRFGAGALVELLDEGLELDRKPGVMARVLETDQTQSTVTLTAPLSGAIDLARNPRLRRWDQQIGLDADGVIPITASPQTIALEDGIEVTVRIDGQGATAHVADWWVFAARAASASIEELDEAPPRGVRHHFARLAVIHSGKIEDCRVPWPGECDCAGGGGDCGCTRCVTPDSHKDGNGPLTIQAAIDAVIPAGGRVCLAPGRYRLQQPLRIAGARGLTLAGDGLATVIEAPRQLGILVVDSTEVSLERLALVGEGKPDERGVGIALVNTADCRVERCFIAEGVTGGTTGIALAGFALRTRLLENVILAGTAIGDSVVGETIKPVGGVPPAFAPAATPGAFEKALGQAARYLITADLAIEDNLLLGGEFGVRFGDTALPGFTTVMVVLTIHAATTRIARNCVLGSSSVGLSLLGLTVDAVAPDLGIGDIATLATSALLRSARIDVRENLLRVTGDGIRATTTELIVADNTLHGRGPASESAQVGIRLVPPRAARTTGSARITGNTIADQPNAAVLVSGGVGTVEVAGNRILRTGLGGIGIGGRLEISDARVLDNVLEDIAVREKPADDTRVWGIAVVAVTDASVTDNVLRSFAPARNPLTRTGIQVEAVHVTHVDRNQLLDIGPTLKPYAGEVTGILVAGTTALDVLGNTVRIPAPGDLPRCLALRVMADAFKAPLLQASGHGLLWAHLAAKDGAEPVPAALAQVAVHGNTLHGGGELPVALITGTCNATFNDNRCRWLPQRRTDAVVFIKVIGATIVSANHAEGPDVDEVPAVRLAVGEGNGVPHATVLGNITHGWIELNGAVLAAPWADLNINA
jgi:Family of unknown function (DUF6519)